MSDIVPVIEGQIVFDLDQIAVQIRAEHRACEGDMASAVKHAIRAGQLLHDAKAQVRHGEWLPWLADNFAGSKQTASNYMRFASNYARVGHLGSVREAIAELARPRETAEESEPDAAPDPPAPTDADLIEAALAPLSADDRRDAIEECRNAHGDNPTPAQVREAVAPYLWPDGRQRNLRRRLAAGQTIVVNLRGDADLIAWATARGLFAKVDRNTPWGNPFEMPHDGDRDVVIAAYRDHYFPHKPSLHRKVPGLKGKALACWCAPEPCHADVIAEAADAHR